MVALDIKQPLGLDCQDISAKYKQSCFIGQKKQSRKKTKCKQPVGLQCHDVSKPNGLFSRLPGICQHDNFASVELLSLQN